jgi:ribosomal protein S18 acetylase RimI-like enzyme
MTVAVAARRQGVGTALTQARVEQLLGRTECVYYAAEPDNVATIELHRRLGFVPCGTVTLPGADHSLTLHRLPLRSD